MALCQGVSSIGPNVRVVLERPQAPTYGDHIRVKRFPLPYSHHGIFVSDDHVIQFGSGIFDKPHAAVEVTTLEQFARHGQVEVVHYGDNLGAVGIVSPPDNRANIVGNAEWLLLNQPFSRYHLVAWNCEHVATFCVTGKMESLQVRRVTVFIVFSIFAFILILIPLKRPSKRFRYWISPLWVAGLYLVYVYNYVTPRVLRNLDEKWKHDHP